jgi:hypothetical protein
VTSRPTYHAAKAAHADGSTSTRHHVGGEEVASHRKVGGKHEVTVRQADGSRHVYRHRDAASAKAHLETVVRDRIAKGTTRHAVVGGKLSGFHPHRHGIKAGPHRRVTARVLGHGGKVKFAGAGSSASAEFVVRFAKGGAGKPAKAKPGPSAHPGAHPTTHPPGSPGQFAPGGGRIPARGKKPDEGHDEKPHGGHQGHQGHAPKNFGHDHQGADDFAAANFAGWKATLTPAERGAIATYQRTEGYRAVNRALRHGKGPLDPGVGPTIQHLDAAMGRGRVADPVVVHRGIKDVKSAFGAEDPSHLVGGTIRDRGFVSTSLTANVADRFAGHGERAARVEIHLPAGHPAIAPPQATGRLGDEREILLPRDGRFRVTGHRVEAVGKRSRSVLTLEPDQS